MLSHGGILNNCEGSTKLLKEIVGDKPKISYMATIITLI